MPFSLKKYVFCKFLFLYWIGHIETKEYKVKLVNLERCKLPENKMDKRVPLTYNMSAGKVNRTTTLIQANFTIGARAGPVSLGVRGYQVQQNSVKDLVFKVEKITCKNPLTFQLLKVIKIKLDSDCYALPGEYHADKINIDDFAWLFTKAMVGPGKYSYDLEFSTPKGIAACIAITIDIIVVK